MAKYTKEEMIKKVVEMLEDGSCEDACFLITEGIDMCCANGTELIETVDKEIIDLMNS